ncbi:protein kinase [Gemmata sp. JC673]|uniref:Protein kinase n=1 Tax=Gemmata algarum TaxID=2975278 RepID=A0ABU5F4M7_9BACT|nr:protein kinase [Gemmata algarum]MDY3562434.1 protein kinase [Gemmata algarum]
MSHPEDTARGPDAHATPRDWFVRPEAGEPEGPLPAAELRARAADGRLGPADRVSADGARWVPAASVAWLAFPAVPARRLVETVAAVSPGLSDPVASVPAPGAVPPSASFSPLESVPGYELTGVLGTGACGVVFRAIQTRLNRVVALKTVRVADRTAPDTLARFDQEAVALARLQHPNIVTVYDCGHTRGRAFFAMELLDGEDLAQRLQRDGPLPERAAWLLARQTAAALDHAARAGVIHRDVKPANLFLVAPPTGFPLPPGVPMVKVTDFGLALTLRGPGDTDPAQTAAGVFLGTPVYMAPEQFRGTVDRRADIYSLGATVFQALTGRFPFGGRTVPEVMRQKAEPPRLSLPSSTDTADLVAAMMAADPADRPQDYAELIARIDALPCLAGAFTSAGLPLAVEQPVRPAPDAPGDRTPDPQVLGLVASRRRRWGYALAAAAVVALTVGAAALGGAFGRPTPTAPSVPVKPTVYVARTQIGLFDGKSVLPWTGRNLDLAQDDEKKPVLVGWGVLARRLDAPKHFRVTLALDSYKALNVTAVLATSEPVAGSAPEWVVELNRAAGTATFGRRATPAAVPEPLGSPVPVPTAAARAAEGLPPYLELRYERAGGTLSVWFNHRPLGSAPDAGMRTAEVRLLTDGAVRIEAGLLEELVPHE